ncbi:MAG: sulfur carrier protein ThiS [Planctomycetota bacterium]|nr:sulfur carrier protein ThiS [Planctomycetota bacterium]
MISLRIEINGEDLQLDEPATVATLIQKRSPRPPFAVEVNKRLVRRPEYTTQKLNDGDRVEIVTLVGGG